jgi:hypothetical protein
MGSLPVFQPLPDLLRIQADVLNEVISGREQAFKLPTHMKHPLLVHPGMAGSVQAGSEDTS